MAFGFQPSRSTVSRTSCRPNARASMQLHICRSTEAALNARTGVEHGVDAAMTRHRVESGRPSRPAGPRDRLRRDAGLEPGCRRSS